MTIRHLKIFIAVADAGKMSGAAEQLYVAQPTVSQAIAELESWYNVRLFERLKRKLFITSEGEKLLSYARHIVRLFDEMESGMRQAGQAPVLAIGATVTVGTCFIGPLVARWQSMEDGRRARVCVDNTTNIERKILRNELDVAVVEGAIESDDLVAQPVSKDEMVFIAPISHPLAGQRVALHELKGEPFIPREGGSGTREIFVRMMRERQLSFHEAWTCNNSEAIKNAVMEGHGVSLISNLLVEKELREGRMGCIQVSDVPPILRHFRLIRHKDKYLSPALNSFIALCGQAE